MKTSIERQIEDNVKLGYSTEHISEIVIRLVAKLIDKKVIDERDVAQMIDPYTERR